MCVRAGHCLGHRDKDRLGALVTKGSYKNGLPPRWEMPEEKRRDLSWKVTEKNRTTHDHAYYLLPLLSTAQTKDKH